MTPTDESQRRAQRVEKSCQKHIPLICIECVAAALDAQRLACEESANEIICMNRETDRKEIERLKNLADANEKNWEAVTVERDRFIARSVALEDRLREIFDRTKPDGDMADQAVHKLVDALLPTEPTTQREPDGAYDPKHDPEVTCWHCKKTFLCDCMDATCRLCGAPFDKKRCDEFGFKPTEPSGGGNG